MCRAMEEMRAEAAAKAAVAARAEGKAEGINIGKAEGINAVFEAMRAAGIDTSEFEKLDIK